MNAEAQQDLSSAFYVTGRVQQASGDPAAASVNFRKAIGILELLLAAHPENVEVAADLENARRGLAETTR
ncbi:MAG: hypothetical protein ACR2ID_03990 [Chthoniobacterales bacterium]